MSRILRGDAVRSVAQVRRWPRGDRQLGLVDVAPGPPLAGLERGDDRVARCGGNAAWRAGPASCRSSRRGRRSGRGGDGPRESPVSGTPHIPGYAGGAAQADLVLTPHLAPPEGDRLEPRGHSFHTRDPGGRGPVPGIPRSLGPITSATGAGEGRAGTPRRSAQARRRSAGGRRPPRSRRRAPGWRPWGSRTAKGVRTRKRSATWRGVAPCAAAISRKHAAALRARAGEVPVTRTGCRPPRRRRAPRTRGSRRARWRAPPGGRAPGCRRAAPRRRSARASSRSGTSKLLTPQERIFPSPRSCSKAANVSSSGYWPRQCRR